MAYSAFMKNIFDPHCSRCARLARFLAEVKAVHPSYHCAPVAPFGDANARLLIVGLAPGKHGANASGRPFTGDFAGILLYQTLFEFGFSNRAESRSKNDELSLTGCRITNAVKCLPPENKPTTQEMWTCNEYLKAEIGQSHDQLIILALGSIAHRSVLKALGLKQSLFPFGHGNEYELPNSKKVLIDTYHCSRYNTQTKRLTQAMFRQVFQQVQRRLN